MDAFDFSCFSDEDKERYSRLISPKRKCEYYYTRVLWRDMGLEMDITYTEEGEPLVERGYISISHCGKCVIIGYSETQNIGVDVEDYSDKIVRVAPKFMGPNESENYGMEDLQKLTRIWSLKETMFKLFPHEHLNFAEQIEVLSLEPNPECEVRLTNSTRQFPFSIIEKSNGVITFCLDK